MKRIIALSLFLSFAVQAKKNLPISQSLETIPFQDTTFSATSKFDFVQGEKIIYFEDFTNEELGDFPSQWNGNASAEIVKIGNEKWLQLSSEGTFSPEMIKSLPENVTLEFDIVTTPNYHHNTTKLQIGLVEVKDKNGYLDWGLYQGYKSGNGVLILVHPHSFANKDLAKSQILTYENGKLIIDNETSNITTFNDKVHVAIWKQKQRLRVYLGEQKVWDIPKAFSAESNINSLVFGIGSTKTEEYFYLSNIRVAVGAANTSQLLNQSGKFSTSGIRFKSNSASILPESHGVLKQIADYLKDQSEVKLSIIGHTDATGNSEQNIRLSEQRALAVQTYLVRVFGLAENRFSIVGKGSTEPIADDSTPEGRASNRRVEFIKL